MAANPTPHEYTKNLRPNIRLSTWEHQDFIDAINDDRLSAPALMKFKELYRVTSLQNIIVPIVSLVPAYFASRWSVGFINRGLASTRFTYLGLVLFYPLFLYLGVNAAVPRKDYTDLIADDGDDGQYIRNSLITNKPGLWQKISKQLGDLNLDFGAQGTSSHSSLEFPSTFKPASSVV